MRDGNGDGVFPCTLHERGRGCAGCAGDAVYGTLLPLLLQVGAVVPRVACVLPVYP